MAAIVRLQLFILFNNVYWSIYVKLWLVIGMTK